MKRILMSLITIAAVSAVAVGASKAFFSDTETSNNNTFTAGSIDLKVDALVNANANGTGNEFAAQDLGGKTIFTYTDLKPGDMGDGKISIEGTANNYWACTRTTSPVYTDGSNDGAHLQDYVRFAFWNDDGDGHWEAGTDSNLVGQWLEGTQLWIPTGLYKVPGLVSAGWIPLADKSPAGFFSENPLAAGSTHNLGFAYCFGDFVHTGTVGGNDEAFTCNGAGSQNDAQGDGISTTMEFYAVQSRNNDNFTCQSMNPVTN